MIAPGYLHRPAAPTGDALVLAHGAGSDHRAPLLVAVSEAFAAAGWFVLRFDLPFRQARPHGPPFPGEAARDREGLRRALESVKTHASRRVVLGGHSYGGRQASMLASEEPGAASALLLLSYPLHPPRRPAEQRTAHFTNLRTPALFAHGARDPFGSLEEMRAALKIIPAPTALLEVPGAGHDLKRGAGGLGARLVEALAPLLAAGTA